LGLAAVGVEHAHARVRAVVGKDREHAVAPDAEAAIAEGADLVGRRLAAAPAQIHHQEVVAQAGGLGEVHGYCGFFSSCFSGALAGASVLGAAALAGVSVLGASALVGVSVLGASGVGGSSDFGASVPSSGAGVGAAAPLSGAPSFSFSAASRLACASLFFS